MHQKKFTELFVIKRGSRCKPAASFGIVFINYERLLNVSNIVTHKTDMNSIRLEDIHTPEDIRSMTIEELTVLAAEMRSALMRKLAAHGGHVGPNLGMVEATIAMHYVFNTPADKIVFDVSHQSYAHKMLTGRMQAFTDPAHYNDVTGFTDPRENPDYDLFSIGHTSTSLALASGLAKARDLKGGHENVVAVIGDGSLGGGEALEGLNYGATLGTNFIVVVNDNDMSIAENHGALYADLRLLRNTNGAGEPNVFRAFGYSYRYVHYGNDLRRLIRVFKDVKNIDHPVVVHINTVKGMGLKVAEANKEKFHYTGPFDLKTGDAIGDGGEANASYTDIFAELMLERMKTDPKIAVLNAGTPAAVGFTPARRREAGKRFIDVGIAEQMATGMSAGLAKGGIRPVFAVVSSFLQRAYDQLSHDVAINRQPAVVAIFHTGIFGMNDETHLGFFDISMVSNIPGINFLAPTCREEFVAMTDWALRQTSQPVALRAPGGAVVSDPQRQLLDDYSSPAYEIARAGEKIALIGAGNFFGRMKEVAAILESKGYSPTLINPRCLSALDTETLDTLRNYDIVITAEDGIVDGGFGQKVAAWLGEADTKVLALGLPKEFLNEYKVDELLHRCGLEPAQIAEAALNALRP